jgi:hypothetical protein
VPTILYVGKTNQLTMTAAGTGPYAYQWYTNGVAISNSNGGDILGATSPTLSFTNAALADSANYYCVVATSLGRATSSIVAVTVLPTADSPVFAAPATATFTALTNQTGVLIGCEDFGATEYSFNVTNGTTVTTYDFKVDGSVASVAGQSGQGTGALNGTGTFGFTSGNANFDNVLNEYSYDGGPKTITINGMIPGRSYAVQLFSLDDRDSTGGQHREQLRRAYLQDPYNLTNLSSTFVMSNNFYVKATFTAAFTNQVIIEQLPGWANGFTDVGDGNLEALVVWDVSPTPGIQYQPASTTRYLGEPVAFNATVYGPAPMGYQWQRDSGAGFTNLAASGVLSSSAPTVVSYPNPAAAMADAGNYRLVVTNSSGGTTSQVATLTVIALPPAGTYDRAVVSYGPLAYWEFNEPALSTTAHDYVGGRDGTYQPFCTNGLPGLPASLGGLASGDLAFEAIGGLTNSWVTVPALNFNTNTVTFTAWINPSASTTQADWCGLLVTRSGIGAGMNYGGAGSTNANMLSYTWNGNSGATYGFISGLTIPSGQWSFVAVAISPTNAALYLINANGFQTTNNAIAHTSQNWAGVASIGQDPNDGFPLDADRVFNGVIDDVAVFTHTLSTADIQNLYARIPLAPPPTPTGLTATAGASQVALSWNATPSTDSYVVKRSTTSGGPYSAVASGLTTTNYTDTGVVNGQLYYYVVASVNSGGQSTNSVQVSAFPIAPTPPQMSFNTSGGQLHLAWPAAYLGWLLQGQTNAPHAGISTNWATVPGSSSVNTWSIPITTSQGSAFFRLIHP